MNQAPTPPVPTPLRVLMLVGTGRSGSTLLANVLGEAPGAVSVGEVRFLFERGFLADRLCGCGTPFSACGFWSAVVETAFGGPAGIDASGLRTRLAAATRFRRLHHTSRATAGRTAAGDTMLADVLGRLYAAIAAVSGAGVVVDSSKLPAYGILLESVPGIDVRFVHLVRDPRAAAFSWSRHKAVPDKGSGAEMERFGPAKAGGLWTVWNGVTEARWGRRPDRYRRVRYEDFVADPGGAVAGLLSWCGLDAGDSPVGPAGDVTLGTHHTVAGNPDRLRTGAVHLRLDGEWMSRMPARHRAVVTASTLPLLAHYGYPLRRPG